MTDEELKNEFLFDFLKFVQVFFEHYTKRKFILSKPLSNESHFITLARAFMDIFLLQTNRSLINIPPGWGKSLLTKMFVAWTTAHFPDSNHLYISYSHDLASSHTHDIKKIMSLPVYQHLFGVRIPRDSSAKDFFKTSFGGSISAFGSGGAITGRDGGLPGLNRYSGAVIVDDLIKPDEASSQSVRERINNNFFETILPRCRGINVPVIVIGQRLNEDDIFSKLLKGEDGNIWDHIKIKALDDAGQARYPEVKTREQLLAMKEKQPYIFYSQYQQEPTPLGGALYKMEDFLLFEKDPEILATFITADTAETDKAWNDKTVFSFWGVYKLRVSTIETESYALHWLDCREISVEPKDLEYEFLDFWSSCMTYPIKPHISIIEKKSTGVTLVSVLKNVQGLKILAMERTRLSGNKNQRFIDIQQYIASKLITFTQHSKHVKMCIEHMIKITPNGTHRFDDIADTAYDAIKAALIDGIIVAKVGSASKYKDMAAEMSAYTNKIDRLKNLAHQSSLTSWKPTNFYR